MLNFIANWRRKSESVSELSRMSNRELADIGISRADILVVASGEAMPHHEEVAVQQAGALQTSDGAATVAPSWGHHNRQALVA